MVARRQAKRHGEMLAGRGGHRIAAEFPPVERMVSSTVERFGDAWKQLQGAVKPSEMNQPRLF